MNPSLITYRNIININSVVGVVSRNIQRKPSSLQTSPGPQHTPSGTSDLDTIHQSSRTQAEAQVARLLSSSRSGPRSIRVGWKFLKGLFMGQNESFYASKLLCKRIFLKNHCFGGNLFGPKTHISETSRIWPLLKLKNKWGLNSKTI